jgi:hypothetical protein
VLEGRFGKCAIEAHLCDDVLDWHASSKCEGSWVSHCLGGIFSVDIIRNGISESSCVGELINEIYREAREGPDPTNSANEAPSSIRGNVIGLGGGII